jgi:hypothetical protein
MAYIIKSIMTSNKSSLPLLSFLDVMDMYSNIVRK